MAFRDCIHYGDGICRPLRANALMIRFVAMDKSSHVPLEQHVQYFSALHVPQRMRLDHWMSILSDSVFPISEWEGVKDFDFELREAPLGCLTSSRQTVSAHRSHRTRLDVERSRDRKFLLFVGELPWEIEHNGHNERILGGDCVLVDSQLEHRIHCDEGFSGVILRLPVNWLQTWIPDAESLVGRRIASDSQWGRIISPIASQLTPELAIAPPLPHGVLVDQLGATLALVADSEETRAVPDLLRRVRGCIWERCTELHLTSVEVATTVGISPKSLHRLLAASKLTFASELLDARVNVAQQILASPSSTRLSAAEIARQSGFMGSAYLTRVLRQRIGQSISRRF